MLLYKITIFILVVTAMYVFFVRGYISSNIKEQIKLHNPNYRPTYIMVGTMLVLICVVLIIISLFHFLFL